MALDPSVSAQQLGLDAIHIACLNGHHEEVVKLSFVPGIIHTCVEAHLHPSSPNDNQLRETPLALAALMGHIEIVQFLAEEGAVFSNDLQIRPSRSQALIYAQEYGFAATRRAFYKSIGVGREHLDAERMRKMIYTMISSPSRMAVSKALHGENAEHGYFDYKLAKEGKSIVVYAPVLRVSEDVNMDRSKTIGIITSKHDGGILMAAHSGWTTGAGRDEKSLDVAKWNRIALEQVAPLFNFRFPGTRQDNGCLPAEEEHRGRGAAGHVEITLATWYAFEMVRRSSNEPDPSEEWLVRHLKTLQNATLGDRRCVKITLDHEPCRACFQYIQALKKHTKLFIDLEGSAGIGPTMIAQDKNGRRIDVFRDVFPVSDDEEPEAVVHLPECPLVEVIDDTPPLDDASTHGEEPNVLEPETVADQRPLNTPSRRRPWWLASPGNSGAAYRDIVSRVPENPSDLLADYKKGTPVWEWPGYKTPSKRRRTSLPPPMRRRRLDIDEEKRQPRHPATPAPDRSNLHGFTFEPVTVENGKEKQEYLLPRTGEPASQGDSPNNIWDGSQSHVHNHERKRLRFIANSQMHHPGADDRPDALKEQAASNDDDDDCIITHVQPRNPNPNNLTPPHNDDDDGIKHDIFPVTNKYYRITEYRAESQIQSSRVQSSRVQSSRAQEPSAPSRFRDWTYQPTEGTHAAGANDVSGESVLQNRFPFLQLRFAP